MHIRKILVRKTVQMIGIRLESGGEIFEAGYEVIRWNRSAQRLVFALAELEPRNHKRMAWREETEALNQRQTKKKDWTTVKHAENI